MKQKLLFQSIRFTQTVFLLSAMASSLYLITGCTTTRSNYASQSNQVVGDINTIKVEFPQLIRKPSFFTNAFTLVPLTSGVAWGVVNGKNIEIEDSKTGKKETIGAFAGGILGGLVGYLGTSLLQSMKPKVITYAVDQSNYSRWLKKQRNFRNNYIGVETLNYQFITFLPKDSYRQYIAHNSSELEIYQKAFGNLGEDQLIDRSFTKNLSDDFLMKLHNYVQNDINKRKIGKQYVLNAPNYKSFLIRINEFKGLIENQELPSIASTKTYTVEDAIDFKRDFPNEIVIQNQIFDKIYPKISGNSLLELVKNYPNATSFKEGASKCLKYSSSLSEFTKIASVLPQLKINIPTKPSTLKDAEKYDQWIQKEVAFYLSTEQVKHFRIKFQNELLEDKWLIAHRYGTSENLSSLKQEININQWLLTSVTTPIMNRIEEELQQYDRKNNLQMLREEEGDAALFFFAERFPTDKIVPSLMPEIQTLTKQYVSIEDHGISVAMGNHSTLGDIAESIQGVRNGGQHNIFVIGIVANSLDYPIKVEIVSTLNYSNTAGVSIFTSTTQKTWVEKYQVQVPAKGKAPFVVVYKDFRVGGTIGSGLLSAGSVSKINTQHPYDLSINYYSGTISDDLKNQQKEIIRKLKQKGNIDINDSSEAERARRQANEDMWSNIEKDKKKTKEKAEEKRLEKESEQVNECMRDVSKSLREISTIEPGWFTNLNCPCIYYDDPSFFGYRLTLKENSKREWTYIIHGFFSNEESKVFLSKDQALQGVCERWYKIQK